MYQKSASHQESMMDHYRDIQLKPDAAMRENVWLNRVYEKFHKALWSLNATDIGVSFPKYQVKLGKVLRIHSGQSRLEALQEMNWLGDLSIYCDVGDILAVPQRVTFRTLSRIQSTMTESKLRRLIKRGSLAPEQVKQYKAKMFTKGLCQAYLELESTSTGRLHRRYFQFGDVQDLPTKGSFDQFGLSGSATIPWF